MAKLDVPSVRGLYDAFIEDYLGRTGQTTPLLQSAFIRLIAWPHAGITVLTYRFGQWVYFQMFLETCSFEALSLYGERVDITYKTGTNCVANNTLSGIGGTVTQIDAGTLFVDEVGSTYKTTSDSPVNGGTAVCAVTCTQAGDAYNVNVGDTLLLANPISDVPDTGVITSVPIEGADPETQEDYRSRVQARYRNRAQGGAPYDYFLWATEVDDIGDAFPYVIKPGITTVYVSTDDSQADRAPDGEQLGQVESSIRQSPDSSVYDRHPIQAELNVLSVLFKEYEVAITGLDPYANTNANRAAVKAALIDYFDSRKPQIPALGYSAEGATVSDSGATLEAMEVIVNSQTPGTFEDLSISVSAVPITSGKDLLPVGTLANMFSLTINGSAV